MSSPVNVLIVDDDRSVQRVLADALTRQGYVVTVERDGEWAVQTFEKKKFDAVLLDLLLPALSGYEVAKRIRATAKGQRTPIIMISGVYKNPLHHREAVEQHGAFALLEKPLDLRLVLHTLKGALGDVEPEPQQPRPPPPPEEEDDKTGEFMADDAQREEVALVERAVPAAPAKKKVVPPPPPPPTPEPPPAKPPTVQARPAIEPPKPRAAPPVEGKTQIEKNPLGRSTRAKPKPAPRPPPPPPPVEEDTDATVQAAPPRDEAPWATLVDKPFARLMAEAYRTRFTGALRLRRGTVKKIVYFREGTPEVVKSNLLVECLGRVLVKEKLISEAECEESLQRMKRSKRMQGTVLIEMGCLSPHNLQHSLVLQLQHKIYDVFSWDDGEYQFNDGVPLPAEPTSLGMTAAQVIYEGVKRAYDEKRLARVFAGFDGRYATLSDEPLYALQDAGLAPEELELLELADGHKTLATLRALELMPAFETNRFFFAMDCAQMVNFSDAAVATHKKVSVHDLASRKEKPAPKPPPLPPPLPAKKAAPELPWTDPQAATAAPPPLPKSSPQPPPKAASSLLPELSAVVSLPRLGGQEGAQREKLAQRLSAMRKLDYFELLGVQRTATREDVKRAYFTLAKEYHPDKHYSSASAEVRELAQQIYEYISTAHDVLTDAEERKKYVLELNSGAKKPGGPDVSRILAAEGKFQRGEELMKQRAYGEAHKLFREAIALYPDEGEFHAWEGWSNFQAAPQAADDAMRSIERSISLNPRLDKGYLFLGYIYKATGRPDRAERQFEKAIQCNPDCTEALRELRLLGQKR